MLIPVIVIVMMSAMTIVAVVTLPFMMPAMTLFLIIRHVDVTIPPVANEIDGTAASVVFVAVLAPMFLMTGRHMHIDGLIDNADWRGLNHDWLRVYDFRPGSVTDVNSAVETRLADTDRNTDVGCLRRDGNKHYYDCE